MEEGKYSEDADSTTTRVPIANHSMVSYMSVESFNKELCVEEEPEDSENKKWEFYGTRIKETIRAIRGL